MHCGPNNGPNCCTVAADKVAYNHTDYVTDTGAFDDSNTRPINITDDALAYQNTDDVTNTDTYDVTHSSTNHHTTKQQPDYDTEYRSNFKPIHDCAIYGTNVWSKCGSQLKSDVVAHD